MAADPQRLAEGPHAYWSPDGQWWWDGYAWRPAAMHPAIQVPVRRRSAFDASLESIKGDSGRWLRAGLLSIAWAVLVEISVSLIPASFHPGVAVGVAITLLLEASFGAVPILILWRMGITRQWWQALCLGRPHLSDIWRVPGWLIVSYFGVGVVMATILSLFPDLRHQLVSNNPLRGSHSIGLVVFGYVLGVVFAPLAEEIMCRGLLLRAFGAKWGFARGAILSSLLFGLAHAYEESNLAGGVLLTLMLGSMGFMMCLLVRNTNRLSSSIAMHALMNTLALTLGFLT